MNVSFFYIYKYYNGLLSSLYYNFFSINYNKLIVLSYVNLLYYKYIIIVNIMYNIK